MDVPASNPWSRRDLNIVLAALIVLAILSLSWVVYFRHWFHRRPHDLETGAVAILNRLHRAQEQLIEAGWLDADGDDRGEAGGFTELCRRDRSPAPPTGEFPLSGAFRQVDEHGIVRRSGYRYVIYLPARDGAWVVADTVPRDRIDAERAETEWCAYAWPKSQHGYLCCHEPLRTFFIHSSGVVLATASLEYAGAPMVAGDAAFEPGDRPPVESELAAGSEGRDGNHWRRVAPWSTTSK